MTHWRLIEKCGCDLTCSYMTCLLISLARFSSSLALSRFPVSLYFLSLSLSKGHSNKKRERRHREREVKRGRESTTGKLCLCLSPARAQALFCDVVSLYRVMLCLSITWCCVSLSRLCGMCTPNYHLVFLSISLTNSLSLSHPLTLLALALALSLFWPRTCGCVASSLHVCLFKFLFPPPFYRSFFLSRSPTHMRGLACISVSLFRSCEGRLL